MNLCGFLFSLSGFFFICLGVRPSESYCWLWAQGTLLYVLGVSYRGLGMEFALATCKASTLPIFLSLLDLYFQRNDMNHILPYTSVFKGITISHFYLLSSCSKKKFESTLLISFLSKFSSHFIILYFIIYNILIKFNTFVYPK